MFKILLIGAGNIGQRYLIGLSKSTIPLEIFVNDTSLNQLNTAKNLWNNKTKYLKHSSKINFHNDLIPIPNKLDIVIVSTNADIRKEIINNISRLFQVRFWIIEKVLSQSPSHLDCLIQSTSSSLGSWVNTPRRTMQIYKKLRGHLGKGGTYQVSVGSDFWGIACNCVHLLDLVTWLTGEKLVSLDTSRLSKEWIESKRQGFFDVTGILKANFSGESTLIMESRLDGEWLPIKVQSNENEWIIDEENSILNGPKGPIVCESFEYHSDLTTRLVKSILETGSCDLPTLTESAEIHRIFLAALLDHWNKFHGKKDSLLPIT